MRIFPNSVLLIIPFLISLIITALGASAENANLIRESFKQNLEICRLVVEGDTVLEATPEKSIAPADISALRARWGEVSYLSAEHIIRYIDSSPFFLVLTRWRAGSGQERKNCDVFLKASLMPANSKIQAAVLRAFMIYRAKSISSGKYTSDPGEIVIYPIISSQFLGKIPSSNGCIVSFQLAFYETGNFFVASVGEQAIANCDQTTSELNNNE